MGGVTTGSAVGSAGFAPKNFLEPLTTTSKLDFGISIFPTLPMSTLLHYLHPCLRKGRRDTETKEPAKISIFIYVLRY